MTPGDDHLPGDAASPHDVVQECDCPADPRIARFFDRRAAQRRKSGERYAMRDVTKTLLAALLRAGPAGHSVLELGCGPGALITELLVEGAASGTGLDLSAEALQEARDRTVEAGVAERATFRNEDGARARLEPHDWVVLDKVICCYPEPKALLGNSIPAARSLYAFALPASYGWRGLVARLFLGLENVVERVFRRPCPGYVHDLRLIERQLVDAGFAETYRTRSTFWHVAIFERTAPAAAPARA